MIFVKADEFEDTKGVIKIVNDQTIIRTKGQTTIYKTLTMQMLTKSKEVLSRIDKTQAMVLVVNKC
jgi:hypothetical protein